MSKTDIVALIILIVTIGLAYFKIISIDIAYLVSALMILEFPKRDTQRTMEKTIKNAKSPKDTSRFI